MCALKVVQTDTQAAESSQLSHRSCW